MAPVIKRIAQRIGHRSTPSQVFLIGISFPGTTRLGDPVATHGPPFVVIALKPDLKKIFKPSIIRYILGRQVAVIIADGF